MFTLFRGKQGSKKTRKKSKSLSPSARKRLDEEYIQYLKKRSKATKKSSSEIIILELFQIIPGIYS